MPDRSAVIPGRSVIWTDALTGASRVVATGAGASASGVDRRRSVSAARGPSGRAYGRTATTIPNAHASTSSTVPVYGSCYDFLYFDGLDSRYSASHCASALSAAGYSPRAADNASAQTALINAGSDAAFFMAGHSTALYENNCRPSCTGAHTAAALLYESPNSNGNLDGLAADAFYASDLETTAPVTLCSEGGACKSQTGFLAYPWGGENPQTYKVNLAVLEACSTAQNTNTHTSMTDILHSFGVGTAVGFVDDISFPVNVDESNTYGDAWANTFWGDLGRLCCFRG